MAASDWLFTCTLDRRGEAPLHRQLYAALLDAILRGVLTPGARLPSTRALAIDLDVSRNTVLQAIEQLAAEGYLEGRGGSGTFVVESLPGDLGSRRPRSSPGKQRSARRRLSRRGRRLERLPIHVVERLEPPRPFVPGVPALDQLPHRILARLAAHRLRQPSSELWTYGSSLGHEGLRRAVARYLERARGIRCEPGRVLIVEGSQQGLDLVARVLLDEGDPVWVEDPGYRGARHAFLAAGARLVPVPVDGEGMRVSTRGRRVPPRLISVTPSNQFPLGGSLSAARRLELLEIARRAGAWILEDDYDSEFRYSGAPLPALSSLDDEGRVLYLGTFSKTLAPALRLGFLVVPSDLVEAFSKARVVAGEHAPTLVQALLADFLEQGHFARHVRRMRRLYGVRLEALREHVARELSPWIELGHQEAGLHVIGWLPPGIDDRVVAEAAAVRGLTTLPLSMFRLRRSRRGGLLLGYAGIDEPRMRRAVKELRSVLESLSII